MNRLGAALAALTLGLGAESCGRCAGVLDCTGTARLSLDGELIVRTTGAAVPDGVISFVRTGGVALANDSTSTTTDGNGNFDLAVNATAVGEVTGDVVVQPPAPFIPYRVPGLTFQTSDVRGDGQILGRIVADPYVQFVGQFERRGDGQLLAGASVTVIWTGGVAVTPDTIPLTAGNDGGVYFEVRAAAPGQMVADVVVSSPLLQRTYVLSGVTFPAQYVDGNYQIGAPYPVGPGLKWIGEILRADNGDPVVGATVTFQWTGGLAVSPTTMVAETNPYGRFPFTLSNVDSGTVVGDLTIHPPAPLRDTTITGISLETFDSDFQQLLAPWYLNP